MARVVALSVLCGVWLLALACEDDSGAAGETSFSACQQAAVDWSVAVAAVASSHVACERDDDCVLFHHRLECASGALIDDCPTVVAQAELPAAQEALDALRVAHCETIPEGCRISPWCFAPAPVCQAGACVAWEAPRGQGGADWCWWGRATRSTCSP